MLVDVFHPGIKNMYSRMYVRNGKKNKEGKQGAFDKGNEIRTINEEKSYKMDGGRFRLVDSTFCNKGYTKNKNGCLKPDELEAIRVYEEGMGYTEQERDGRLYYFVSGIDLMMLFERKPGQSEE